MSFTPPRMGPSGLPQQPRQTGAKPPVPAKGNEPQAATPKPGKKLSIKSWDVDPNTIYAHLFGPNNG
jgi:hypothetical protein